MDPYHFALEVIIWLVFLICFVAWLKWGRRSGD